MEMVPLLNVGVTGDYTTITAIINCLVKRKQSLMTYLLMTKPKSCRLVVTSFRKSITVLLLFIVQKTDT